jgi:hypothetical protein
MPLRCEDDTVHFEDTCAVEEALTLTEHLREHPGARADLSRCTYLHTSLAQVLLAMKPEIAALPGEPFMARWLNPLLETPPDSPGDGLVKVRS